MKTTRLAALVLVLAMLCAAAAAENLIYVSGPAPFSTLERASDLTELEKPEGYEETNISNGSGSVSIYCPGSANAYLDSGRLDFWYQLDWDSSHQVFIQLILKDEVGNETLIAQSGIIPKGHRMNSLQLLQLLQPGEYKATARLFFFDGVSETAGMGSQLAVTLHVCETEKAEAAK